MSHKTHYQAIIVGAGLSGLSTARALIDQGLSVRVLEAETQIAAPWRARHPQLRLNIHEHFIHLPGKKLAHQDGTFVRRDSVIRYLEEYSSDIENCIDVGVRVQQVCKLEDGWKLKTSSGTMICHHLIIATGRERTPYLPDWPGQQNYSGDLIHSADLGDIKRFDGKKILVIGAGNSGSDILNHLSRSQPEKVWVSVRHGTAILPNRILGYPIHRTARLFNLMPETILNTVIRSMQRLAFGDLATFGLNDHPVGAGTRMRRDGVTPALDDGFVSAVKQGRFEVVTETLGFERDGVQLADGRLIQPDAVLCATGYRSGLEPLVEKFGVLDCNGHPLCPMGETDSRNPGLWFTGFRPIFTGFFDAAGIAAKRIASAVVIAEKSRVHSANFQQEETLTTR